MNIYQSNLDTRKESNTLNIYIINSGFQLVSSVLLAKTHKNNLFICLEKNLLQAITCENSEWRSYHLKFKKLNGIFGRQRGVKIYLKKLFSIIKDHKKNKIIFHMPVISGSQYNYIIKKAKNIYGEKNIEINIIPDGSSNIKINHFTSLRKKKRVIRKKHCIFDKLFGLKYTPYHNDKYGIISDTVNKIYTIPGMPHEYPKNKTEPLPNIDNTVSKSKKTNSKTALILGQRLISDGFLESSVELELSNRIKDFLKKNNIDNIYYIPHTISKIKNSPYELLIDGAKIVKTHKPVELYMLNNNFNYVIAVLSTGLITSKLFFGKTTQVISIGTDLLPKETLQRFKESIETYKKIGIKVL